jgi:hypothetical protein
MHVQLLALISLSSQIQMEPPFWNFHHIHMNAFYLRCQFRIQWKMAMGQILKKSENFMTTYNHTNFTLNGKKFAFLN